MRRLSAGELRASRNALAWTVQDLAYRLAVDPLAITRWEEGTAEPDEATMRRLTALFHRENARRELRRVPPAQPHSIRLRTKRVPCLRDPAAPCALHYDGEVHSKDAEECADCVRYKRQRAR